MERAIAAPRRHCVRRDLLAPGAVRTRVECRRAAASDRSLRSSVGPARHLRLRGGADRGAACIRAPPTRESRNWPRSVRRAWNVTEGCSRDVELTCGPSTNPQPTLNQPSTNRGRAGQLMRILRWAVVEMRPLRVECVARLASAGAAASSGQVTASHSCGECHVRAAAQAVRPAQCAARAVSERSGRDPLPSRPCSLAVLPPEWTPLRERRARRRASPTTPVRHCRGWRREAGLAGRPSRAERRHRSVGTTTNSQFEASDAGQHDAATLATRMWQAPSQSGVHRPAMRHVGCYSWRTRLAIPLASAASGS